jgi:hypothetical protein
VPNISHKTRTAVWSSGVVLGAVAVAVLAGGGATTLAESTVHATAVHDSNLPPMHRALKDAAPTKDHSVLAGVVSVALVQIAPAALLGDPSSTSRSNLLAPLAGARWEAITLRRSTSASRPGAAPSTASAPWYVTLLASLAAAILSALVSVMIYAKTRRNQLEDLVGQRLRQAERERLEDARREQELTVRQRRNEREDRDAEYQDVNKVLREVNTLVQAAARQQVLFSGDYDFEALQRHIDRIVGNSTPPDLKPTLDKLAACIREVQNHVLPTQDQFDAQHPTVTGDDYSTICRRAAQQRTAVEELSTAHRDAYDALRAWARVDV